MIFVFRILIFIFLLENRNGTHSIYTEFWGNEVMFHVSTLLPYVPNDEQQLGRKRHIGNDIVTIVFGDQKDFGFSPKWISSQFLRTKTLTLPIGLSRSLWVRIDTFIVVAYDHNRGKPQYRCVAICLLLF